MKKGKKNKIRKRLKRLEIILADMLEKRPVGFQQYAEYAKKDNGDDTPEEEY